MAVALAWYIDSLLPQACLGWAGAVGTRLCCFSSRRKGSETFEDDCHFPTPGPAIQQPNFEEDALWALLRKIPGTLFWMTMFSTVLLPTSYPTFLAWLVFFATVSNGVTLFFTLLYTYRGFTRMAQSMSNPVKIPPLVKPSARKNTAVPGEVSPQGGARSDAIASQTEEAPQAAEVLHLIAICRCTEPIEVLEETIDHLSMQSNRANYIILLCLEAKDKHAAAVGETLVRKYAGVFHRVMYAIHPSGIEWEVPGKSANVNWGARAAYATLEQDLGARALDRIVVTVADCDAKVSEHYFNELSVRFAAAAREKRETLWAPPMLFDEEAAELAAEMNACAPLPGATATSADAQSGAVSSSIFKTDPIEMLFGRNCKAIFRSFFGGAIPGPVKVADQLWAVFVLQQLAGTNWVRLPCSTYSVGIKLIASVGYWDAGVESVPEDYHTALKLYWGTSGRARLEPIYHPVIYQHIDGGSWFNTVYQRYQQGVRHMWGATDVAYITWLAMKVPTVPLAARMRIVATVYDVHVHASMSSGLSTFGFAFISLFRPSWMATPEGKAFWHTHEVLMIICVLISLLIGCLYEWYAKEMVHACKRPYMLASPPNSPSNFGSSSSLAALLDAAAASSSAAPAPASSATVAAASSAVQQGAAARPVSVGSHSARSPGSAHGGSSPVHVVVEGGTEGLVGGGGAQTGSGGGSTGSSGMEQPALLAHNHHGLSHLGLGASAGVSSAGPSGGASASGSSGGGAASFMSVDTSGAHAHMSGEQCESPGRQWALAAGMGVIPVRDRSFLASMATCTATTVWEYVLSLLPWLWSPVCCVLYLLATAAAAQTKLLWTNRMRPHVSPKSIPTPSATPRSSSVVGPNGTPVGGSGTPVSRMASLEGGASTWESARQLAGAHTPQAGAAGRSIRLQLPSAAFGRSAASSGQLSSLLGGPLAVPSTGGASGSGSVGASSAGSAHGPAAPVMTVGGTTPRTSFYGGSLEVRLDGGAPSPTRRQSGNWT